MSPSSAAWRLLADVPERVARGARGVLVILHIAGMAHLGRTGPTNADVIAPVPMAGAHTQHGVARRGDLQGGRGSGRRGALGVDAGWDLAHVMLPATQGGMQGPLIPGPPRR